MSFQAKLFCYGAMGGAVAALLPALATGFECGNAFVIAVLVNMLAGAAAGSITVNLLAATDPTKTGHCYGLALAAGLSWQPVLNMSTEYIVHIPDRQQEASVARDTAALDTAVEALRSARPEQVQLQTIGGLTRSLTMRLGELRSGAVRANAVAAVTRSMDVIVARASDDESNAVKAIAGVLDAASSTDMFARARDSAEKLLRRLDSK